jgi:hypothetical protein
MPTVEITLNNFTELKNALANYKDISYPVLESAIDAATAEINKEAVDPNFQFKTPRARRTGFLSLSFAYGIRRADNSLTGSIGPTAKYAVFVEQGTSRIAPNPFMERIAEISRPFAQNHFEDAIEKIVETIARKANP